MTNSGSRAGLWHAATLCLIAGFVDVIGYVDLGHVFTANMTGNTVLLAVNLVKGDWLALSYAATITAFALGVVTSTLLKLARVSLPSLLFMAGALLLFVSATRPGVFAALCQLAFVMGLQGGAITMFSGIRLPTVVVTSTLVNLIDGLVLRSASQPDAQAPPTRQLAYLATAWVAYGAGGGFAVLAQNYLAAPLIAPAVLYVIIAADLRRPAR